MSGDLRAPFPYFGGKSSVADLVWARFGKVKQYIEPFCGSAAMLLANPAPASLEVVGDMNMYIANFWRAVRFQPDEVWKWSDYPVSHVDLYARHQWLVEPNRKAYLAAGLADPEWHGDAKVAGWWVWGQCAWIGSGWCEGARKSDILGQIPFVGSPGMGMQSTLGNAGCGLQSAGTATLGKIPHHGDAGRGLQSAGIGDADSPWREGAHRWLVRLSVRLERVRILHGAWDRCLNNHYGGEETAVFLDPPYRAYEKLYAESTPVADAVADWAAQHPEMRIAVCGHIGDYPQLESWTAVQWERPGNTYGGDKTKDLECIWFSPSCIPPSEQLGLF